MKHQVSELTGALLDAAVAKAEGWTHNPHGDDPAAWWPPKGGVPSSIESDGIKGGYGYHPAHNWAQGGPIIQRERISLSAIDFCFWQALVPGDGKRQAVLSNKSPNALIAAMRAFVASKLGDEVELP